MLCLQKHVHILIAIVYTFTGIGIPMYGQPIDPLSLHFEKEYQVRNFYNSSVVLSELDLQEGPLYVENLPKRHLTLPGCNFRQERGDLHIYNDSESPQESHITLGKLFNYAAIDLDIRSQKNVDYGASVLLSLQKDEANKIVLTQKKDETGYAVIQLEIVKNSTNVFSELLSGKNIRTPNTLRIHLTGKFLNVLNIKNEAWTVLGSFDISEHFELRNKELLSSFSVMVGAKLGKKERVSISGFTHYLTTGTAQADPKILHYEDGSPIIEDNTIWVAMTTRGYGTQLYQGIYRYDLTKKEWKITGTLVFNKGDGLLRQWSASDVLFDRKDKKWKIYTVSHRDDHRLYLGETTVDPRFGLVEINCSRVKYSSVGNEEDPSVIWDSEVGKWRMAFCKFKQDGYQTVLMEADEWDGVWKEIGVYKPTSSTGVLIQKVGGKRYVFIGRGNTPCPLEVLTYPDMVKTGELNLSEHPKGKNIWPAIVPIPDEQGTAYYLLTFDRDAWTGQRTYGNIHWYGAREFAKGFWEY